MARNTAVVSISLPQDILLQLNQWARLERKSKTELIKEALSWYRQWKFKRDWTELRKKGEEIRKEFGLKTEQDLYDYIHGD
jgi:metal-responsive CopG/Arc/MetJ family transcriptional regulator